MKRVRSFRGFSLVEVVISLFIFGVSLAIASSIASSIKATVDAQDENLALRIAATQIDDLRNAGYANVPATGTSFSNSNLSGLASPQASTTVSDYNDKTKTVTAGVSWRSTQNATRYVSVSTLITSVGGL